jgi:hypothetical protein
MISVHQDVILSAHKQVVTVSKIKRNGTIQSVRSFSCPCNVSFLTFLSSTQAIVAGSSAFLADLSTGVTGRFEVDTITCIARLTSDQVLFGTNSGVLLYSLSNLVEPFRTFDKVAIVSLIGMTDTTFFASTANQIRLYNVGQRNALLTARTGAVYTLSRVPKTSSLASVDNHGVLHFWDDRKLTPTFKSLKLPGDQRAECVAWCESKRLTAAISDNSSTTVAVFHDVGDDLGIIFSERYDFPSTGLTFKSDTLVANADGEIVPLPFAKKSSISFSDRSMISVSMSGYAIEAECPAKDISVIMRKRLDSIKPQGLDDRKRDMILALGAGEADKALAAYADLGFASTEISCALAALTVRTTASPVWRSTLAALRIFAKESQLGKEVLYALELSGVDSDTQLASLVSSSEVSVKVRWWLAQALHKSKEFQDSVAKEMAESGNLEALDLIAGSSLGAEGVRTLLREFLARTSDVQTITELAMKPRSDVVASVLKESFFRHVMGSYLELLSRWRRWKERSRITRVLFPESNATSVLKCYFCDYALTGGTREGDQRVVTNRCPNELCHKPLPKCSVCLGSIFAGGSLRVWTARCAKCKHGGHQDHLLQWFKEFDECPVAGCRCECARLDGGL